MPTYSINDGTIYESNKLNNINEVLTQIPDNTSKMISPKDVRDGIYTLWENVIFKPTLISGSSQSYIGIDQDSVKNKIFIGKRSLGGQNIMSPQLLSSDGDIFIFNTKSDNNLSQQNTKVVFLSGTNSNHYLTAPYLYSHSIIAGTYTYIDFSIRNPSPYGNIDITSDNGNVSLNGVVFPSVAYTSASASEGDVLRYRSGVLRWEDVTSSIDFTNIHSNATVSISGSPVLVNGSPIEFTDLTPSPTSIGSIHIGDTFSNVPVVEMIRKIIYPYLSPLASISISSPIIEAYNSVSPTTVNINYNIDKRSPTASLTVVVMANSGLPSGITGSTNSVTTGNVLYPSNGVPMTNSTETWTLNVSDGITNISTSASLTKVFPYFYGTSTTGTYSISAINNNILSSLTKLIKTVSDTTANISGQNVCIYFAYPSIYPDLSQIIDNNGFNVISSFTKRTANLNSPNGLWSNISYNIYIYGNSSIAGTTSVGVPPNYTATVSYQFKH